MSATRHTCLQTRPSRPKEKNRGKEKGKSKGPGSANAQRDSCTRVRGEAKASVCTVYTLLQLCQLDCHPILNSLASEHSFTWAPWNDHYFIFASHYYYYYGLAILPTLFPPSLLHCEKVILVKKKFDCLHTVKQCLLGSFFLGSGDLLLSKCPHWSPCALFHIFFAVRSLASGTVH